MMRVFRILALFAVLACVSALPAQAHNPFMKKGGDVQKEQQLSQAQQGAQEQQVSQEAPAQQDASYTPRPNPFRRLFAGLLPLQRELHQKLSRAIRQAKAEGSGSGTWLALLAGAFLYGLVHALGPGHGKSVASAYFLARGGRKRHGFYMGMTTASVHALSAVVTVVVLKFVLETTMGTGLEGAVDRISQVSFLLIALIGLGMLVLAVREYRSGRGHALPEPEAEAVPGGCGFLKVAVLSGLVPCPGAAIILFFSLALGVPGLGVLAVAAMSLGMGVTISAAGMLTLAGRGALLRAGSGRFAWVGPLVSVLGALLILLLGLLFFWVSLA